MYLFIFQYISFWHKSYIILSPFFSFSFFKLYNCLFLGFQYTIHCAHRETFFKMCPGAGLPSNRITSWIVWHSFQSHCFLTARFICSFLLKTILCNLWYHTFMKCVAQVWFLSIHNVLACLGLTLYRGSFIPL